MRRKLEQTGKGKPLNALSLATLISSGFLAVCDFDSGIRRFESFLPSHSTMGAPAFVGNPP